MAAKLAQVSTAAAAIEEVLKALEKSEQGWCSTCGRTSLELEAQSIEQKAMRGE